MKVIKAASWEEAFSLCREINKPITVQVGDSVKTIFPSGYAKDSRGHKCRAFDAGGDRVATG